MALKQAQDLTVRFCFNNNRSHCTYLNNLINLYNAYSQLNFIKSEISDACDYHSIIINYPFLFFENPVAHQFGENIFCPKRGRQTVNTFKGRCI